MQIRDCKTLLEPKTEESHFEKVVTCPGSRLISCGPGYRPGNSPRDLATAHLALDLHQLHLPKDPEGEMPIHVPRGKIANLSLTLYPEMALQLRSSSS